MANKKLNALITIGGALSGSLKGAFSNLKGNMGQLGSSVAELNKKQRLLSESMRRFAGDTRLIDNLKKKYAENERQIKDLTGAYGRLAAAKNASEENDQARGDLKGGISDAIAGALVFGYPIKAAMEFEDKMADVKKVVDAPPGDNNYFAKLGEQILDLSTRIPMAANEIGELVAAGGQSGIASEDLLQFAEAAGKMSVAFGGISASDAGQKMAELKSAFGMTIPQVVELADKMNALDNDGSAAATDIMEIVQRIGPLGAVANVASGEIAALGSTLRGMGVQNEIAATGIKNLMLTLTAGSMATKSQKAALKELGLGSKQVAGSMQKDSQTTIIGVLKRIKLLDKVKQPEVLNALFGKEVVGSIAPLLNNLDQLQKNFGTVGDKSKYAGSMQREFDARAATTSNQIIILRNWMNRIAITLGSTVLPIVNELVQATFPYLRIVTGLITAHPQLSKGIFVVGASLVAMRIASLGAAFSFITLKGYWLAASTVLTKLDAQLIRFGINFRALNIAMIASPIGLLVTGIVVAVAALSLAIWRNWDAVKAFTTGALQGLWDGLGPVKEMFGTLWEMLKRVGADFGITGENVQKVVNWFKELFTPVNYSKDALDKAGKAGQSFGKLLADGINFALYPLQQLIKGMSWLDKNFDGLMKKAGDMGGSAIESVKGWFRGNQAIPAGGPVGFVPGNYGRPAPEIPNMAQSRGTGGYNDNRKFDIHVTQQPGESGEAFARRTANLLKQDQQQQRGSDMHDPLEVP